MANVPDAPDDAAPTGQPSRRGRAHSDETRAACVAALLTGQGIDQVAAAFKIPVGTLKQWRAAARRDLGGTEAMEQKREKIGELLVDYLDATLRTLKKQQVVFSDPAWLKSQNAADLAVLHGVLTDKSIRLLEALGGASPEPAHGMDQSTDQSPDQSTA